MLLSAKDRVTHFAFDMRPADVLVIPPAVEHDGIFHGASSYAALRFDLSDVAAVFAGEARLSDPATWCEKKRYRADPANAVVTTGRLPQIISRLARHQDAPTEASADFGKRAIVDYIAATIFQSLPPEESTTLRSALRLARDVEDYLAAADPRPVHVSELCAAFRVSRRGLHRAFHDVFGVGPVTLLRHKRLCAIHSALKNSSPSMTTVTEVAPATWFCRARAILSVLSCAVWRISVGDPGIAGPSRGVCELSGNAASLDQFGRGNSRS